jgi:hypothetical protein
MSIAKCCRLGDLITNIYFFAILGAKIMAKVLAGVISPEVSLFFLADSCLPVCPHMAFSLCMYILDLILYFIRIPLD